MDKMPGGSDNFARVFGEALDAFLKTRGISESDAARRMEMGRGTLNTYTHGVGGKRSLPSAEIFAKACTILGFELEYGGYTIVAQKEGKRAPLEEKQLHLQFTRQIDLAENGAVTVGLKKPPGKIELSVSLKAIS
jgi:transcriptional regulator with XRE-family HTH domain